MRKKKKTGNRNGTLSEQAYQIIKRGILQGEFEEGSFLSAPEVMGKYGISRTPFRESCNRLHNERILEVVPRRGYLIPEMSFRTVRELFEVRLNLEGVISELAATRATAAQIEELENLAREPWGLDSLESDSEKIVKSNTRFHLCLARMTHNRELVSLAASVLDHTERLSYMELISSRIQVKEILNLHSSIVEAIRNRDPAAARSAVIEDIRRGKTDIFGRDELKLLPGLTGLRIGPAKDSHTR